MHVFDLMYYKKINWKLKWILVNSRDHNLNSSCTNREWSNKQEKHTWIIESKKKLIGLCDKYPTFIYNRRPAETWDLEIYRKMFSCKRLNDFRMRSGTNLGKSILISWQFSNTNCYLFDTVSESWELSVAITSRFLIIRPGLVTFGKRGDYTKNLSEIGKDT